MDDSYRIHHERSGYRYFLVAGENLRGRPAICGCTPDSFPVISLLQLKVERKEISSAEELQQYYMDKAEGRTGKIVSLLIPSLKVQSLDIPMTIRNGRIMPLNGSTPDSRVLVQAQPL
ncbi:hypothetical protein ACFP81_08420 [Deinococcus lacus]|uniref:Uncharacterized protein n=1 Tax=Deinococcus lacus TaxID=392561 RepID=A0ABW1YCJ5_9DEIO